MKNEIVFPEGEWLELDSTMLSKISQSQSNTHYFKVLEMWATSISIECCSDVVKLCHYMHPINDNCSTDLPGTIVRLQTGNSAQ